ncbi:potassium channel family protein [Caproiciproducens faecalis]|uniref:NAD-binding protein n=1 Tax=Caproiciproducens faecalis TaxID=2820301 RepID=A0ABS7DRC0_9FIRM|nr:NAD-binding protein [Caproiciproducens faecalis]MBW7573852.1 NAD-binding protein [Caproiciproducens faecalis]
MNILLVGGHTRTRYLAAALKARGYHVRVVGDDYGWCKKLADDYEVETVCGDGTDPLTLKEAAADKMDMIAAVSGKDAFNLLVCEIAKKQMLTRKTLAVVNDPKNQKLFEELGVDKCVSFTRFLEDRIEQEEIADHICRYLPIADGRVVVCEAIIDADSKVLNRKLWEIPLPPQSIIGCIIREDQTLIPQGNTQLEEGDHAVILSSAESVDEVTALLSGHKKR